MKKLVSNIFFIICLCVFIYSGYSLFQIYSQNHEEKQEYIHLQEVAGISENEDDSINFDKLKAINEDVVAWIRIPDTHISYPVVKGKDNSFYLNHTYTKAENYAGAVFVDAGASDDFMDRNTLIYGHNVKHGTMFAELENFKDASFYEQHPIIYIDTEDKKYHASVISMYQTESGSDSYQTSFSSEEAFQEYVTYIKEQAMYPRDLEVNGNLITLSTCSYERNGQPSELRYVVHAVLEEVQE